MARWSGPTSGKSRPASRCKLTCLIPSIPCSKFKPGPDDAWPPAACASRCLVKGATWKASGPRPRLRGWPQAPLNPSSETDANYKRMCTPCCSGNLAAMDVGIGSAQLVRPGYGLVLAYERDALERVQFEMLEAWPITSARALRVFAQPAALRPGLQTEISSMPSGISFAGSMKIPGPENFLRARFRIRVDTPEWKQLEKGFLDCSRPLPARRAPRRTKIGLGRRRPPPWRWVAAVCQRGPTLISPCRKMAIGAKIIANGSALR